jgi:site-specific recombinase XerD
MENTNQEDQPVVDEDQFLIYLQRNYDNKKTIEQYYHIACRFTAHLTAKGRTPYFNQDNVDWILSRIKNNTLNRAGLRAIALSLKVRNVDLPKKRGSKAERIYKFLEPYEVQEIIEKSSKRVSTMVSLLFDTGLRLFEIINLKKKNINLDKQFVRGIGKRNKEFEEDFSKKTKAKLIEYLSENDYEYPFHYNEKVMRDGKETTIKHHDKKFWKQLKDECEEMGIPNVHPHRIRHSLGHYLRVEKGWDLEQVREKLRHKDIGTTRIYATATKEEVRRKMKKVFEDESK